MKSDSERPEHEPVVSRYELFPPIEPYKTGLLRVSDDHEIYYEESGNPNGRVVIYFHSGPGAGSNPNQRRFFDPGAYRIVLFDQRGAGKSKARDILRGNTTAALVEDVEKLRIHLGIERAQLFGGSWGSTLALIYAQKYPHRVTHMVLRGSFLGRKSDIDYLFQYGTLVQSLYSDAWKAYVEFIPEAEREDLIGAYHSRIHNPDPAVQLPSVKSWVLYEQGVSGLHDQTPPKMTDEENTKKVRFALIESQYMKYGNFIDPEQEILRNMSAIAHIPAVIVHGTRDAVAPPSASEELHQLWPASRLVLLDDSGHAPTSASMIHMLVGATEELKSLN